MSWTKVYWDMIDHLYWAPQYVGLKSIPQRFWTTDADTVTIPRKMTNPSGPLYRRLRSRKEFWTYVRRQEETFNHIFDITFAVLPGDVTGEILGPLTEAGFGHTYDNVGREVGSRYSWGDDNITNPDGFYIAADSILAVELKFNAKTSLDQLTKYLLLFVAEELNTGRRENLDLLYIFNKDPVATFSKQIGVSPNALGDLAYDDLVGSVRNKKVRMFLQDNDTVGRDVLSRIKLTVISWQEFFDCLSKFSNRLSDGRGDRTLKRLIDGLTTEIAQHPLSNVLSAPSKEL